MSTTVLVQYNCDARNCDRVVRSWHWTGLGALSTGRSELRRTGWKTVGNPRDERASKSHFCAEHADEGSWIGTYRSAPAIALVDEWERGQQP